MNPKKTFKNQPRDMNTMFDAARKILDRAWKSCPGEYPISSDLRREAEIYLAECQNNALRHGQQCQTANEQKATALALSVMCEFFIANWREARMNGKWPVPGGK